MNSWLRVGDIVMLDPDKTQWDINDGNPIGVEGKVVGVDYNRANVEWVRVKWNTGRTNAYYLEDDDLYLIDTEERNMRKLEAFRKQWAGRSYKCVETGDVLVIPDDVKYGQFFSFGNCFIDVGDSYYSRGGGKMVELTGEGE